jgi:DnaJ-class molecular chaperone
MKRGGGTRFDPDLSDLFFHMFGAGMYPGGGGGGASYGRGNRSPDAEKDFEVTLEELYKGKQVKMMSKRKVVCPTCQGYILLIVRVDRIGVVQSMGRNQRNVPAAVEKAKKSQ